MEDKRVFIKRSSRGGGEVVFLGNFLNLNFFFNFFFDNNSFLDCSDSLSGLVVNVFGAKVDEEKSKSK